MTTPELFSLEDPSFVALLVILLVEVVAPLVWVFWAFGKLPRSRR